MDVYKENIQYYGSPEKSNLRIVIRGDFQNKGMIGYTWYPTVSMRTMKYFSADAVKHKLWVHQLDFIAEFV